MIQQQELEVQWWDVRKRRWTDRRAGWNIYVEEEISLTPKTTHLIKKKHYNWGSKWEIFFNHRIWWSMNLITYKIFILLHGLRIWQLVDGLVCTWTGLLFCTLPVVSLASSLCHQVTIIEKVLLRNIRRIFRCPDEQGASLETTFDLRTFTQTKRKT